MDDRDFGKLEAQVAQLMADVKTLTLSVATLNDLLLQAKGGWRSLVWMGGVVSLLAGCAGWIAAHLKYNP